MAAKGRKQPGKPKSKTGKRISGTQASTRAWLFLAPVIALVFALFLPALSNQFTNWDDVLYVTSNPMMQHLGGSGWKEIWSTPVVSNYHPLTMLSLALNAQLSGMTASAFIFTNLLIHLCNTALVFALAYSLSNKNAWVSAIVALLFGMHPMHVESVVWVSERKDVLYTLFYLAAMLVYLRYLRTLQTKYLIYVFILGAASLLSKPAAIVLPLSLLLLDYLTKRTWSVRWIVEKIPLFLMSLSMAYITVAIQSHRAIATVEAHSIFDRIFYGGFGWTWYLLKIIFPLPLSALHPFPKQLSLWYYLGTVAAVAAIVWLLLKGKDRRLLFGIGFYTVNLLLVLQVISIGNAVVAERYSYVPYIGIFFWAAMAGYELWRNASQGVKTAGVVLLSIWLIGLIVITERRIPAWKNSQTLWADVLRHYPTSTRAWTNKGLDFYDQQKFPEVIDHLTHALEADSLYADALEWRTRTYLDVKDAPKALADAERYARHYPGREAGEFLLARSYDANGQAEQAVHIYDQLINTYAKPEYYNNRGTLYFNKLHRYAEAQKDFEEAIRISPNSGSYYLNLSRCYYMQQDLNNAKKYAVKSNTLGTPVDSTYYKLIGLD